MEREKVIRELEECIEHIRTNDFEKIPCWGNCQIAMMDALGLMKEQEAKPVIVTTNAYGTRFYHCPKCYRGLYAYPRQLYCSNCGQEVTWDG